jgi:Skp family chaperone for outer membrane proteins
MKTIAMLAAVAFVLGAVVAPAFAEVKISIPTSLDELNKVLPFNVVSKDKLEQEKKVQQAKDEAAQQKIADLQKKLDNKALINTDKIKSMTSSLTNPVTGAVVDSAEYLGGGAKSNVNKARSWLSDKIRPAQ